MKEEGSGGLIDDYHIEFAHDSSVLHGHKSEKVFFSLVGIREGRLKKGVLKGIGRGSSEVRHEVQEGNRERIRKRLR
jgi:hypothetical protein